MIGDHYEYKNYNNCYNRSIVVIVQPANKNDYIFAPRAVMAPEHNIINNTAAGG